MGPLLSYNAPPLSPLVQRKGNRGKKALPPPFPSCTYSVGRGGGKNGVKKKGIMEPEGEERDGGRRD